MRLQMQNKNFKIDNLIYSKEYINRTCKDFEEVWKIIYKDWILNIYWESEEEIENIFNEFMNYIIWLINE